MNANVEPGPPRARALFCQERTDPLTVRQILEFRKKKFVLNLGWRLSCDGEMERDEFDRPDTVHCGIIEGEEIVGCFRAIRTDQPYLAEQRFPDLAKFQPYPKDRRSWEISRLGVDTRKEAFGRSLRCYASMLWFARSVGADSLVAFCDLAHERLLGRIGIKTQRFGEPRNIGTDAAGREIRAVAGAIVMSAQDPRRLAFLLDPIRDMEVEDGTALLRRFRLSA